MNFRSSLYPPVYLARTACPFSNNRASSPREFPPVLAGSAVPSRSVPPASEELAPVSTQRAARRGTEHSGTGLQRGSAPPAAVLSYGLRKNHLVPHRHDTRLTCRRTAVKSESLPRLGPIDLAPESTTFPTSVLRLPPFDQDLPPRVVGHACVNSE